MTQDEINKLAEEHGFKPVSETPTQLTYRKDSVSVDISKTRLYARDELSARFATALLFVTK